MRQAERAMPQEAPVPGIHHGAHGLADLAQALLTDTTFGSALGWPAPAGPPGGAVLLLADIVTDDGGACVLDGEGPNLSVVLETDQAVVAEGSAEPHATAAGSDVSGHSFIAFASGVTVYFPAELEVAVAPPLG
jgi:hypothetical protein